MGRKPNTFKSIVTDKTTRLDVDPELKVKSEDFLGKTGEDTRIMRKAVRGSKLESLYKMKGIDESKVLAETETAVLLKTKKGNKVLSKREMGKRAKVKGRKEKKVWAETEDSGDDDNIISLRRGRDTTRIEPLDEATETEQKKQEKEPPKVVKPKISKPAKSRKTPMEWSRITSDEESDEPEEWPLNRL